jgi:hypothetical protein
MDRLPDPPQKKRQRSGAVTDCTSVRRILFLAVQCVFGISIQIVNRNSHQRVEYESKALKPYNFQSRACLLAIIVRLISVRFSPRASLMHHHANANVTSILEIYFLLHATRRISFCLSIQCIECQIGMPTRAKSNMGPSGVSFEFDLVHL